MNISSVRFHRVAMRFVVAMFVVSSFGVRRVAIGLPIFRDGGR
jgi:hypothetical protein